ncbi:MAG: hypothetical protein K0S04_2582 [Herbinix sp.]|jgi:hypothetical protein|nr:hypothetical protein [Herbinix sp.]
MSRSKKLIRNIFIIILLSLFLIAWLGLSFTPLSVYKKVERGNHFGPSQIVHIEDYKNNKFILGRYDRWVSCSNVRRALLFFWAAESVPITIENDNNKALCYTWSNYNPMFKVHGVINDEKIKKVEVTLSNGDIISQTEFYDDLFLLIYDTKIKGDIYFDSIRAYDGESNIVFESEY